MIPPELLDTPEKRAAWLELFKNYETHRRWAIRKFFKIRTKDQKLAPLRLNEAQRRFYGMVEKQERERRPVRIIAVKPRKVGLSTGIQGLFFHTATSRRLQKGLTVAHDLESTQEMFSMNDLFFTEMPAYMRPMKRYGSRDELSFENPDEESRKIKPGLRSQLKIGTAGKVELGRSKDIHLLHMSELPFWQDAEATELSVLNAVPMLPSTMVFKESTPMGVGNKFHRDYLDAKAGRSAFEPFFMAWWEFREYSKPLDLPAEEFEDSLDEIEREERKSYNLTLDQLNWRRWCIDNMCGRDPNKFLQEYPSNDVDCLERETRVGTSNGYVRICDIEVGSMSDHGRVIAKANKGEREVFKLTTKRGYTLRATAEHLIAVGTGELFSPCEKTKGLSVTLESPVLAEEKHVEKWNGIGRVRKYLLIDEEWAAFLGYFMGDGSLFGDTMSMACEGKDSDLIDRIGDLCRNVWGVEFAKRTVGNNGGGAEWRVGNKEFGPILERLGCLQRSPGVHGFKRKVCVPECIWRSPKPVVKEFLRYLFEADGWASKTVPLVKFFSKHLDFTQDVQRLLLAFGVLSTVRPVVKKADGKEFPGNELILNAREAILFMQEIGFVSERKRAGNAATREQPLVDKRCPATVMADDVVSVVADGTAEVWDLQIEGEPVFSAGGILVHNCFLVSGRPVFDPMTLKKRLMACVDPVAVGNLYEEGGLVKIRKHPKGFVRMWKPPLMGHRYVIAADVAEGLEHGDFSTGHVLDWETDENVAEWHGHIDPWTFGYELGLLGKVYNMALIGVEANKDGGTVNTRLRNDAYPHLFYRMELEHRSNTKRARLGWQTSSTTKPLLVNALDAALRGDFITYNKELISECMTFVHQKDGTLGAQSGCYDDRVIGGGIAQEIRKRHGLGTIFPSLNAADAEARRAKAETA